MSRTPITLDMMEDNEITMTNSNKLDITVGRIWAETNKEHAK